MASPYHEKTLGQLFCDRDAGEIVRMLEAECAAAGVRIVTGCVVTEVRGAFELETSRGGFQSAALVIATGGLSIPKMGATPFGYDVARQFGLAVVECRPALAPLTFGAADRERFDGMAGVSTEVSAAVPVAGIAFREKMLFTHRGLSGPAILQASSYWRAGKTVEIDLVPGVDFAASLAACRAAGAGSEVRTLLARHVPKRLADRWCQVQGIAQNGGGAERSRGGGDCGGPARLARPAGWYRRLREGRSHCGGCGHRRDLVEDDGVPKCPGSLLRW